MSEYFKVLSTLGICLTALLGRGETSNADLNPVTAMDVLLEPDARMSNIPAANNACLLARYPKGSALDATHRPHITMIQRSRRNGGSRQGLRARPEGTRRRPCERSHMKLDAFKYYYVPSGDIGLAWHCRGADARIALLQDDIIAAVAPFTVDSGIIAASTAAYDNPGRLTRR